MKPKLILASGSKNRQTALRLARIPFTSIPAAIDEKAIKRDALKDELIATARAKVEKVASNQQGIILGADGSNLCGGRVLEKPRDLDQAKEMLVFQSEKPAQFLTGFYLLNTQTGKTYQGLGESSYRFGQLTDQDIAEYIKSEPVLTWAAAFSPINSMAIRFVHFTSGSISNFAFSMPLDKLMPIFKQEGVV